jgi:hypothetical protein
MSTMILFVLIHVYATAPSIAVMLAMTVAAIGLIALFTPSIRQSALGEKIHPSITARTIGLASVSALFYLLTPARLINLSPATAIMAALTYVLMQSILLIAIPNPGEQNN